MNELTHFDAARRELMLARDIDEVKDIRDKAAALQAYLKQQGESLVMQNAMAEIKIRAERKAGELISEGQDRGEIASQKTNQNRDHNTMLLSEIGVTPIQSSRFKQIASIPDPEFEEYIAETRATEDGEVTSAGALRLAKKLGGGRDLGPMMTSQTSEWYTTPDIIKLAQDVMGGIDLDPCSNSKENPNVPAKHHLTKEDDGLSMPWFGRVYMNPPYGTALPAWTNKLVEEYKLGHVDQAIALTPARPDTKWFRSFRDYLRCFMFGRVKFNDHENSAPFPTMLVGIGCDRSTFIEVMSNVGDIYEMVTS